MLILLEPLVGNNQIDSFRRSIQFDSAINGGDQNNKIWVFWRDHIRVCDVSWNKNLCVVKPTRVRLPSGSPFSMLNVTELSAKFCGTNSVFFLIQLIALG